MDCEGFLFFIYLKKLMWLLLKKTVENRGKKNKKKESFDKK